jgi:putative acetyltransferase
VANGGSRIGAYLADGALAGFILLDERDGHLDQFCIRHDLKGQGHATALMDEVKRRAPSGIHLTVNALNSRAIRFYERQSFRKTGEGFNPTSGLPTLHYRWQP